MSTQNRPQISKKGLAEAEDRARRQAEALRANLARRKTQSRARAEDEPKAEPCSSPELGLQDREP